MHYTPHEYINLLVRTGNSGMVTNDGFENLGFSHGSNHLPKMDQKPGITNEQYTAYIEGYENGLNAK